jgi:hypothetical protein
VRTLVWRTGAFAEEQLRDPERHALFANAALALQQQRRGERAARNHPCAARADGGVAVQRD